METNYAEMTTEELIALRNKLKYEAQLFDNIQLVKKVCL